MIASSTQDGERYKSAAYGGTVLTYFLVSWLVDALNERSPFLVKVLLMFLIGAIIYGSNENLNLKRRVDQLNKLNGRNSSGS